MKKYTVCFVSVLLTSILLASCVMVTPTPIMPSTEMEDQGQISTLESILTEQAATIESLTTMEASTPTPVESESELTPEAPKQPLYSGEFTVIESGGLVFKLPVEVAESATVSTVLPDDPNEGWPEFALPARRKIDFSGYVIQDHFHTPVIYVYPLEKMLQAGLYGGNTASNLLALLDYPSVDLQAAETLPFLPPFNAAQVFHVLEKRLESEHGRGIRYLTLYSQAIVGVTNYEIFYTYQGLSLDGRYYIAAVLPVNSSLLPDAQLSNDELDQIVDEYSDYIEGMTETIRAENGGILTPSLAALDALMMSIVSVD